MSGMNSLDPAWLWTLEIDVNIAVIRALAYAITILNILHLFIMIQSTTFCCFWTEHIIVRLRAHKLFTAVCMHCLFTHTFFNLHLLGEGGGTSVPLAPYLHYWIYVLGVWSTLNSKETTIILILQWRSFSARCTIGHIVVGLYYICASLVTWEDMYVAAHIFDKCSRRESDHNCKCWHSLQYLIIEWLNPFIP